MTNEDVLMMAKAGFTAVQIAAMNSVAGNGAGQQEGQQAGQQAGQQVSQIDMINQQLAALTGAVQLGNIMGMQAKQLQSTDDILAEIIAPKPTTQSVTINGGK